MMMPAKLPDESLLRAELVKLLCEGQAHVTLEHALENLVPKHRSLRPGVGDLKSIWEILEHMRIAQRDILDYIRDPSYTSPTWPEGYWKALPEEVLYDVWMDTVEGFLDDREVLVDLANQADLTTPLPHTDGHTVLRELLLAADHNAYHLGQIVFVRKLLEGS
ncbi:MAG: DinB family protein [Deinococcota bacterium]